MKALLALLVVCALFLPVYAKAPPTVVVTVRGVTMTSTGVIVIELPEEANVKGEVITADVSTVGETKSGVSRVLGSPWVQGAIYVAAGVVLVILFQFVKGKFKLSGRLALAIVSTLCALSGVALSSVLGGLNVLNAGGGAALVVASSQLVYRLFVKK